MSSPASPGASPLRIVGFALLGVGVIAGVIGLATLAIDGGDGDGEGNTAAPSVTQSAEPPPGGAAATGPDGAPAPGEGSAEGEGGAGSGDAPGGPGGGTGDGTGDGTAGGTGAGEGDGSGAGDGATAGGTANGGTNGTASGGGTSAGGTGGGQAAGVGVAPLRVYNNSTISGLADRASEDFRGAGWPVDEVGNYSSGIIPTSTVYYRPGTGEQAYAERLGAEFQLRVEPRFTGLEGADPGVIVIVTRDYGTRDTEK